MPAIVFLCIAMAPFQVPDELAHALRTDQIGHGTLISDRVGGMVQGGLADFGELYRGLYFHPEVEQTPTLAAQARAIGCGTPLREVNFQNTAQ